LTANSKVGKNTIEKIISSSSSSSSSFYYVNKKAQKINAEKFKIKALKFNTGLKQPKTE